jgi:SEC-C motif-containing protein
MTTTSAEKTKETSLDCPCGSGKTLKDCCTPFIKGKQKPTTAEELLRARYTAFVIHDVDYILSTHHSETRKDVKREEIEDWSKNSVWHGLKVVQKEGGEAADEKGLIAFCAEYEAGGKKEQHWEQSEFRKEAGEWKFYDAKGIQTGPYKRAEPKLGRNDPCSCGSGKKFKKCCAA